MLEHCSPEQKQPVLEALFVNLKKLVVDQYGNYVIQHIIGEIQDIFFCFYRTRCISEHGTDEDRGRIIKELKGEVLTFAQHKFASNVIEKCLTSASNDHKNVLISEVCGEPNK